MGGITVNVVLRSLRVAAAVISLATTPFATAPFHGQGLFVIFGKTLNLLQQPVLVPVVLVVWVENRSQFSTHVSPPFAPTPVVDRAVCVFFPPAAIPAILLLS